MADTIVLCADGSELSTQALATGLAQLKPAARTVIVTAVEAGDPTLVMGTGIAGGTMSPGEFDTLDRERVEEGETVVRDVATALGLPDAETLVLRGEAGAAICDYAAEIAARSRHRDTWTGRHQARVPRIGLRLRGAQRAVPGRGDRRPQ